MVRIGRLAVASALWCVALPVDTRAQAFPPISRVSASPEQAIVNEPVQFWGSASIDPDGGPSSLTYLWDFGDGTSSTVPDPVHVYTSVRAYVATLTVSDGFDSAAATVTIHVLLRPLAGSSAHSTALALSDDGNQLWVANPDSGSVTLIDIAGTPFKVAEVPACAVPRTLAVHTSRGELLVACQGSNTLAAIDLTTRSLVAIVATGAAPYGVVVVPGDGAVLVSNQGDSTISVFTPDLVDKNLMAVADGPRAIAVTADGTRAFVTHYVTRGDSGMVSVIDLVASTVVASATLADDPGPDTSSSGRGVPNLLSVAIVDPAGRWLWVGGLKSNTSAGLYRRGVAIASENWVRGLAAPVNIAAGSEVIERRIDTNNADSVSAIVFSPDGRYAYMTHQGAAALSIYDLSFATLYQPGDGNTVPFAARVDVGDAPQAVAMAADGTRLFVSNYLSRDLSVIDVNDPATPVVRATLPVTSEPLNSQVILGKRHFYSSREPMHSRSNYIACASCHPDGGMSDGRVWDFTQKGEGLRNTKDLRGVAGLGDGPLHWSANFDEVQDFELDIINTFQGTGLAHDGLSPNPSLGSSNAGRSVDLDALAAYVSSLTEPPPSPLRSADGSLSAAARRGRALFFSATLRCTECHPPPRYTVSSTDAPSDVGTISVASGGRLGATLSGIDVPSLVGAWASAPYFHDGSAASLRDVFRGRASVLEAQLTADLPPAELADLEAFILSLDAHDDTPIVEPGGCRGAHATLWTVLVLLAGWARRIRRGRGDKYE